MLADRVTVLRDGAYVATRDVAEVSEDDLVNMMVGRRIENLYPKLAAKIGQPLLEVRDSRRPGVHDVDLALRAARSWASRAWWGRAAASSPRRSSA